MKFITLAVLGLFVAWFLNITGVGEALFLFFVAGVVPGMSRTISPFIMLLGFSGLLVASLWYFIGQEIVAEIRAAKRLQKD